MSGRRHFKAIIEGYNKPIFPKNIWKLNRLYDEWGASIYSMSMECLLKTVQGFVGTSDANSSDGYSWETSLEFRISPDKVILVALPFGHGHENDEKDEYGLSLDRSIAFYTKGEVSKKEVMALFNELVVAFLWP